MVNVICILGKREELIKSSTLTSLSNGSAPTPPQYRISPLPSSKIRTKALLNGSAAANGRRSIFEGMSDEEEGEDNGASSEAKTDFFVPRRSVKKLNLKAVSLPPHPAGIVLRRCGYLTIPTMEELAIKGLDENGKCVVDSFSIIRRDYGQIFFQGPIDIANLNLDEIGMLF